MSDDPILGVVVAHAGLGPALVDAVCTILGDTDRLCGVSNEGCGREAIVARVEDAVNSGRRTIIFVDLPGGSCHMAALRFAKEQDDIAVVSGVNLPMLLDFASGPAESLEETVARVSEAGGRSISART